MNKYNTTTPKQIENIHYCLKIIATEIKRVCEKNNIKYFLLSGSLLGAVRHKDFIPWDDDMDIGMLRNDYEKFIEVCEKDLNKEKFFIQRIETDPGFAKFYIRVLLYGTSLDYCYIKNTNSKKCLFVDVFPYDKIPNSKFLQKKQSLVTSFARRLYRHKLHYVDDNMTFGCKLELLLSPFFSKKSLIKMYNKEIQKYNKKEHTIYVNSPNAGYGYYRERIKTEWITELKDFNFGELILPGFVKYDEYLTFLYGDYMTLPEEDQRVTHRFENLDFGIYTLDK